MQCNTMQLDSRDGSTHIASFLLFSPFPSLAYIMIIYIEQVTNSYIDIIPLTEVVKYHVATVALDVAQLADASGIKINTLSVRLDSSHSIFFFPRGFFAPLKREYIHIYVIHIPPFFLSFFFFSLSLSGHRSPHYRREPHVDQDQPGTNRGTVQHICIQRADTCDRQGLHFLLSA